MPKSLLSLVLLSCLVSLPFTSAHVGMSKPCGRGNPSCYGRYGKLDYDTEAPLNFENEPEIGGPFPCKGLPAGPVVARYKAGSSISVVLGGSDTHDGGHCQFTMSFDKGRTWVVLSTVTSNCLRHRGNGPYHYNVPLPSTTPAGPAIFAYTFVNREGNKEFYMSCSDIYVDGPKDGSVTGPELLVFRLSPSQSRGRKYEPLGEWKYGGDDGVSRLNKRPIITVNHRGVISRGRSRPSSSSQAPPSPHYNKRPTTGGNNKKAPARGDRRPNKELKHSHSEDEDDADEDDCDAECSHEHEEEE